mmetsp:Transcript_59932/g.128630  ORF Transcript_59932/g.128630 Transcript_59932/m.128630 type:complete len:458 (-) Transcript_59932:87-1460(-)
MVSVTLKNTFLSFETTDEVEGHHDEEQEMVMNARKAASPRSRSVECPTPNRVLNDDHGMQIEKLNKILSPMASPRTMSVASESPALGLSPKGIPAESASAAVPSGAVSSQGEGPTTEELKQLQQRLEELCKPRNRRPSEDVLGTLPFSQLRHVTSNGSVSTMSADNISQASSPVGLHQVRSCGSVSTLLSEHMEEHGEADNVEFDLTIEEDPQVSTLQKPSRSARDSRLPSWADATEQLLPQGRPRGSFSPPRGSFKSPPTGTPQECHSQSQSPSQSPSPASQERSAHSPTSNGPMPKDYYRHGYVPKNLNLEEEYKNTSTVGPPTTLMIRNIPNRYTQRELIMELEDLGFAGTFDFLYIPLDKGTMSNVGYAFVNFVHHSWAEKCMTVIKNYRFKRHRKISGKIASVSVAHIQGLEANLAHYEYAAVNTAKLKQRRPVIMANISQKLSLALALDED